MATILIIDLNETNRPFLISLLRANPHRELENTVIFYSPIDLLKEVPELFNARDADYVLIDTCASRDNILQQVMSSIDERVASGTYQNEIASTLAHELTQPLLIIKTYIAGCIRRIEENVIDKDQLIAAMKSAISQVEIVGNKIHRIKNFIHKGTLQVEKTCINEVIKNTLFILEDELKKMRIHIVFDLDPNLSPVKVDKMQIEQVLLNLINNSLEAMSAAKTPHPELRLQSQKIDSHTLTVSIADNGPGIDNQVIETLFTPFFTTKKNGMGIGLRICRNIIEAHGGRINAKAQPKGGSLFQFTLPITDYEN